jgi:hypothetical protein
VAVYNPVTIKRILAAIGSKVRNLGIKERAPTVKAVSAGKVPTQNAAMTASAGTTAPVPAATKTNR